MDTDTAPPPHLNGDTATGEGPEAQQQAGSHAGSVAAKAPGGTATAPASEDDGEGATNVEVSGSGALTLYNSLSTFWRPCPSIECSDLTYVSK